MWKRIHLFLPASGLVWWIQVRSFLHAGIKIHKTEHWAFKDTQKGFFHFWPCMKRKFSVQYFWCKLEVDLCLSSCLSARNIKYDAKRFLQLINTRRLGRSERVTLIEAKSDMDFLCTVYPSFGEWDYLMNISFSFASFKRLWAGQIKRLLWDTSWGWSCQKWQCHPYQCFKRKRRFSMQL